MTIKARFQPRYGTNQVLTAGAASATVNLDAQAKQVRIVNTGANKAYVRVFNSATGAQAASTADAVIASGQTAIFSKGDGDDRLSHISAAGTTLEVITGEGF